MDYWVCMAWPPFLLPKEQGPAAGGNVWGRSHGEYGTLKQTEQTNCAPGFKAMLGFNECIFTVQTPMTWGSTLLGLHLTSQVLFMGNHQCV